MQKKWLLKSKFPEYLGKNFPEFNASILQLLYDRGLETQEAIDEFFNPDYHDDVHDPFLFSLMGQAVKRIFRALEANEKIVIYGDYDTDGVCGSAILFLTLTELGAKNLSVYIPHRITEGYGLNSAAIENFIKQGTNLIITTDCGIANVEQVALAQANKVDVIVTDHHEFHEKLPPAYALIHPKLPNQNYPFKHLSGGGVAFKLAQALLAAHLNNAEAFVKWLLDLVSLSTVADMVPLKGENRTLTKYGLLVLKQCRRPGLLKLMDKAGLKPSDVNTTAIGFQLAPRLNAAGRMNHANEAFQLLIAENPEEAQRLAQKLNEANSARQTEMEINLKEALAMIGDQVEPAIVVYSKGWSQALLGLIAGRLSDKFYRPAFAFTENRGKLVASARSVKEINLMKILNQAEMILENYGGHAQAAGLELKLEITLEEFKQKILALTNEEFDTTELAPTLAIDLELKLSDIRIGFWDELKKFEPFGEGNSEPIFMTSNVAISEISQVGKRGSHLKFKFSDETGETKGGIGFGLAEPWTEKLKLGDQLDIVYKIIANVWNGNQELQLKVIDLKKIS